MADIEKWKKIIISLPEQVFFDLIRNYLGDVKTPFNKHSLIEELAAFFRREKNAEKIISLIDKNDAAVLSTLEILGPVRIKDIYRFFEEKKSYHDFFMHLQNLEERMLVCTDESSDGYPMLVVSPLLRDFLMEKTLNPGFAVPGTVPDSEMNRGPGIWLTDPLLFSVFSFLLRKGQILKLDGNFRKKVTEELKVIFPDQLASAPEIKIDIIRKIFRRLGLVRQEGDYFRPVVERWKELAQLDHDKRMLLCTGAAFSRDYRLFAPLIDTLMNVLCAAERGFSEKALFRVIDLLCIKNMLPRPAEMDQIVLIMDGLGFIEKKGEYYFPNYSYTSFLSGKEGEDSKKTSHFTLQPNFDIHVSGDISFRDGLMLAITAEINRYSEMLSFSLTRESFLRALEADYDSASVLGLFSRLSGYPVPQNILFSVGSWEKEYRSLAFYSGIVLVTDEKKGNIVDNSGQFSPNLCKKLAPNVYLVNKKNIHSLLESFKKAGIENLPSPDSIAPDWTEHGGSDKKYRQGPFPEDILNFESVSGIELDFRKELPDIPETVDNDFMEIREKIEKSQFLPEQKEVLSGRLERKLILFPEQISRGNARYEKTEARGLDYNGKVRIAEEVAGKSGYLVEIVETGADGGQISRLIRADRIEKEGSSCILKGQALQDESEVSVNVSKISLIRKIKTSLFVR